MKNYLTDVIENKEYSSLKPVAERTMIDYYRLAKDFTRAIETADNIIEKYKDDADYISGVLYAKGLILAHDLNQPDKAIESYSLIVQRYPENGLAALAENELSILGAEVQKNSKLESSATNGLEFATSNYPNPFNPVTVINYSLPSDENVTIKVYDVLGSEVATLVNEHIKAGNHTISFNAGNLSSGVYFYTISAGSNSISKKIILAK